MPDAKEVRESIDALSGLAQTAWFSLLGALAYFSIVLLSTTNADFLTSSSKIGLPVVNAEVSTSRFFQFGTIILTVLYVYLHFYCNKLWRKIEETNIESLPGIKPSLISDLALTLKPDAMPRGGNEWDWAGIGALATALLIWVAQPVVLAVAWYKSAPANDARLDWTIGVCLVISVSVGLLSCLAAFSIRNDRLRPAWARVFLVAFAVLLPMQFVHYQGGLGWLDGRRPPMNIDREDLVGLDGEWALAAERREEFRQQWCEKAEANASLCGNMPANSATATRLIADQRRDHCFSQLKSRNRERCARTFDSLDRKFDAAWAARRKAELRRLTELDLTGRDLSKVSAVNAKFVAARLQDAILTGANLHESEFEGAKLMRAELSFASAYYTNFDRSDLTRARMRYANLTSSSFEHAILIGAELRFVELENAHLVSADLGCVDTAVPECADLTGAYMKDARLNRSNLTGAILSGAILDGTDLSNVVGMTQDQLDDVLADEKTKLPALPATRLVVWDCWTEVPERVSSALSQALSEPRDLSKERLEVFTKRLKAYEERLNDHLCPPGVEPRPIKFKAPEPPTTNPALSDKAAELAALRRENERLRERLALAEPAVAIAAGEQTEPEPSVVKANVLPATNELLASAQFDTASARLSPGARERVAVAAIAATKNPPAGIKVIGYADRVGRTVANQTLAEARARAVAELLIEYGLARDLIKITAVPETDSPVPTDDGIAEPLNRSVLIIAVPELRAALN